MSETEKQLQDVDEQMPPNKSPQLKPYHWKPGQSGNPKGRPKKPKMKSLTALLKERLAECPGADKRAIGEFVIDALIKEAIKGNVRAAEICFDRIDGKLTTSISGPNEGAIEIRQTTEVISRETIQPALEALVASGVVTISTN